MASSDTDPAATALNVKGESSCDDGVMMFSLEQAMNIAAAAATEIILIASMVSGFIR